MFFSGNFIHWIFFWLVGISWGWGVPNPRMQWWKKNQIKKNDLRMCHPHGGWNPEGAPQARKENLPNLRAE